MSESNNKQKTATKGFADDGAFEVPAISLNIGIDPFDPDNEDSGALEGFYADENAAGSDGYEVEVRNNKPPVQQVADVDEDEDEEEDGDQYEEDGEAFKEYSDTPAEDYSDYSDIALHALTLQKDGLLDPEFEIDPKLDKESFRKMQVEQHEKNKANYLYNMGYNPDLLKYTEYLLQGGDPAKVQEMHKNNKLSELEVEKDTPESLENRKKVILEMYKDRGLKPDRANKLYQALLEEDGDLEEAQEARNYFKQQEDYELQRQAKEDQLRKEQEQAQMREQAKAVETIISSRNLAGIEITEQEAKELKKALYEPTETIEYIDNRGNKKKAKVTKYQKVQYELENDLGQQLAMIYVATSGKGGFTKDSLKNMADIQSENDILDTIARRKKGPRHRSTRNASGRENLSRYLA